VKEKVGKILHQSKQKLGNITNSLLREIIAGL
jgi:hypothetical protein